MSRVTFEEDDLPPPDDDDLPPPEDDLPPPDDEDFPEDEPPMDFDEFSPDDEFFEDDPDFDDMSLPSLTSQDDRFFDDADLLSDPEDDDYGDPIEDDLSDPEDYGDPEDEEYLSEPDSADGLSDPEDEGNPTTSTTSTKVDEKTSKEPISEHPSLIKYFKMLKVGLPKDIVALKMTQDNFNPAILDLDPTKPLPSDISLHHKKPDEKVPISEHPVYSKYLKMIKVGIPKPVVAKKLTDENIDPSILDLDPTTLVSVNHLKYLKSTKSTANNGESNNNSISLPMKKIKKQKKKKLFLKGIDQRQLSQDSLWAKSTDPNQTNDEDDELSSLTLDADEFNRLFIEENNPNKLLNPDIAKESRKKASQTVQLLDFKRSQNGAISLARIKHTPLEIVRLLLLFHTDSFSLEQLKSLLDYLPTEDEKKILLNYSGDIQCLGIVERYMLAMIPYPEMKQRLIMLIYKHQFLSRWHDCKHKLTLLETTCDQIKLNQSLKKVLKIILKIINQLKDEDEEQDQGITLDSLLKLSQAKAFDKKTSVLQYIIMIISRNNHELLNFPEEIKYLHEISKFSLDTINQERIYLESELISNLQALHRIEHITYEPEILLQLTNATVSVETSTSTSTSTSTTHAVIPTLLTKEHITLLLTQHINDFENKLKPLCHELQKRYANFVNKYLNILSYFGEDSKMNCQEFFTILSKFLLEFIQTRNIVEKIKIQELKKQQRLQQQQQAVPGSTTDKLNKMIKKDEVNGNAAMNIFKAIKARRIESTVTNDK